MVMMTMKAKLKWVILIALTAVSAAIVAVVIFHGVRGEEWAVVSGVNYRLNAKNEEERLAFLEQFGWTVRNRTYFRCGC